jgi:hypothetical protein
MPVLAGDGDNGAPVEEETVTAARNATNISELLFFIDTMIILID